MVGRCYWLSVFIGPILECALECAPKAWHCFDEYVLPFAVSLVREDTDARCIAVWPRQRGYQSGPEHIAHYRNDRNSFRCLLNGAYCFIP
jgi:hypothetical protein